jgi:NAD(P)-dependent dehydrogenase (short-subunit alcohol dehydrogenase family)
VYSWIKTSLAERFFNNPETNEKIIKGIPAGRWGEPADFKGVTVFLASSASDYISGARIFIDGGTHSM